MQEIRWNDDEYFSGPVSKEEKTAALLNPRNKKVMLLSPGSEITLQSGARYVVQGDGSWRRIDR